MDYLGEVAMTKTPSLPLLIRTGNNQAVALRNGEMVSANQFLHEVRQLAELLPDRPFVFNLCTDRYRFLTTFCAAMLRGQTNLLPPNHAEKTLLQMHAIYPDAYAISDRGMTLPTLDILPYPGLSSDKAGAQMIPEIAAHHIAAIVFTSGSTGEPQPHAKTWHSLVQVARLQSERLAIRPGSQFVSTIPPQHMYGLESSLMMPLHNGGTLHAGQPLFPADISTALAEVPAPRVLITTPLHLRICLEEAITLPPLTLILSAAAPLSQELAQRAENAFGAPVCEIYGCTEAGAVATRRTVEGDEWHLLAGLRLHSDNEENTWVDAEHLPEPIPLQDMISYSPEGSFRLLGRKQTWSISPASAPHWQRSTVSSD